MHATGRHPWTLQVDGMLHPVGVSLESGGNLLVHPSVKVLFAKDVLTCAPPRICAEGTVSCPVLSDSRFTPARPRFRRSARAASTPLVWVDRKSTRLNSSHRCISYAV